MQSDVPEGPLANCADNRPSVLYSSSIHRHSARKDDLPNHNVGWKMSANLRSEAGSQPRLPDPSTNTRRYHGYIGMEGPRIRGLGRSRRGTRSLGVQARKEGSRVGNPLRPEATDQTDFDLRILDRRVLFDKNRGVEIYELRILHHFIFYCGAERWQRVDWRHLQYADIFEQDFCWTEGR